MYSMYDFQFQMTDGLSLSAPKTPGGAVPKDRGRKIGHRRVDEKTGTVTYKKVCELCKLSDCLYCPLKLLQTI